MQLNFKQVRKTPTETKSYKRKLITRKLNNKLRYTKLMNTNSGAYNMNCKCGTKKAAGKTKGVIENGRFHCLRA